MKSISVFLLRSVFLTAVRFFLYCAVIGLGVCLSVPRANAFSTTLTGSIQNWTTGQPGAGDQVVLIRVSQTMQEEMRVTAGASGVFTLKDFDPASSYVIRVIHQGVNYEQALLPGETSAEIPVFDATPRVHNLNGSITVYRMKPEGNTLHVTELDAVRNESTPPRTQTGPNTFDVYLPPHARIVSARAAAPSGSAEQVAPVPVPGENGHYALPFPLQPGETHFAIEYDLPYSGEVSFHPKLSLPVQQLAVMLPVSMQFLSHGAKGFVQLPTHAGMAVQSISHVEPMDNIAFEISGPGRLSYSAAHPRWNDVTGASILKSQLANQTGTIVATVRQPLEFAICFSAATLVAMMGVILSLWVKSRRPVRAPESSNEI